MTRNIIELIAPVLDAAVEQCSLEDEDVTWAASIVLLPTPNGMLPQSVMVFSMRNPLLGQPPLGAGVQVESFNSMLDEFKATNVVRQVVQQLREARAQALSFTNGAGPH